MTLMSEYGYDKVEKTSPQAAQFHIWVIYYIIYGRGQNADIVTHIKQ